MKTILSQDELTTCNILGTNINVTDMEHTVQYLKDNLNHLRGNYICVSNVHTTVMAYRDDEYRTVQNSGAMALPDGKPLSMVSRRRGYLQARRVPGPDLMIRMFEESRDNGYRHFFYGSTEHTLSQLRKELTERYPYLQIAGMYSPPFRQMTDEEDADVIERINRTNPDFIWVALGAPKQEKWMHAHQFKVGSIMIGVGAAFDFSAGTVKRAPRWMQEMCLEWFYRILQDPKRLIPRYVSTNFAFLKGVVREEKKLRKRKKLEKDSLKIAMIGHKRIPTREGGVEIVVNELSTRMVERGHRVDAYNRKGSHISGRRFVDEIGRGYKGVRIISIPTFESSSLNAIVYTILASIRVLFGNYDVIHYHAEGPCIMLWLPKLLGKRVIATIHGLDWQRAKWGNFASEILKFGEKVAIKWADEVIVLSKNMQEYFLKEYGRKPVFIPNGISKPERKEPEKIVEFWNLHKDEYILFLARIVPEKGAHYLINAYKKLDTTKKLVIAGGSSHSSEYFNNLRELAADDTRILFTNFVGGRALEELYSNAYFFVLPSDVEGMAISLLEAMSYGNCCLVSDIPENTEVTGEYAETFHHADTEDLARKLKQLLMDEKLVEAYRSKAADYICQKYNWDNVVRDTINLYRGTSDT